MIRPPFVNNCFDYFASTSFEIVAFRGTFFHVFGGFYEGPINPDADEVSDHCWLTAEAILTEMKLHPELYTPWFQIYMDKHAAQIEALITRTTER